MATSAVLSWPRSALHMSIAQLFAVCSQTHSQKRRRGGRNLCSVCTVTAKSSPVQGFLIKHTTVDNRPWRGRAAAARGCSAAGSWHSEKRPAHVFNYSSKSRAILVAESFSACRIARNRLEARLCAAHWGPRQAINFGIKNISVCLRLFALAAL